MTNQELMQMMTDMGLHEGGMENWVVDNAWLRVANAVEEREREACAKICDDRVTAYQYATDPWAQEHIKEAKHLAKAIKSRGQE